MGKKWGPEIGGGLGRVRGWISGVDEGVKKKGRAWVSGGVGLWGRKRGLEVGEGRGT